MNEQELQKAEQIIKGFPNWTRPMSTEESDLMERYWDYKTMQCQSESESRGFGMLGEYLHSKNC